MLLGGEVSVRLALRRFLTYNNLSLTTFRVQRLREAGTARRTLPPKWLGESVVTYFCFVESSLSGVQHMQPMDAESVDGARTEAAGLLRQHRRAYAAHIFSEDQHIATIRARDIVSS